MIKRIICVAAVVGGLCGTGGWATTTEAVRAVGSVCPAGGPTRITTGATLVLVVSLAGASSPQEPGAVHLCLLTAADAFRLLYHPLPTGDVALSADRRLLAYRDTAYRVHLAHLPGGDDRVIGRGVLPQFSHDGRYLAFVTSDTLPAPSSTERLVVYDLAARRLVRVGPLTLPRIGDWPNAFSWSPRADTLAWSTNPSQLGAIAIIQIDRPAPRPIATLDDSRMSSSVGWGGDGRSLLYWRRASTIAAGSAQPRFSMMQWPLPNGPAGALAAAVPIRFVEGVQPAPASDAGATRFASLLGIARGGFDQIILYARDRRPRAIPLPGEPRMASFAPSGTRSVTIWTPPYGQGIASRAALMDAATGKVQELGGAVGAFWTDGVVS